MPQNTNRKVSSSERTSQQEIVGLDVSLLDRILSQGSMANKERKERTRKITLVGKYPKYLAQSLNLSDLPKYDKDDRIWRESRSEQPRFSTSRRPGEIGGDRSRKVSNISDFVADDSDESSKLQPLRLPPIMLPRVYTLKPTPLQPRYFFDSTPARGPITDEEWEELKQCRYLRPGLKKYKRTWSLRSK